MLRTEPIATEDKSKWDCEAVIWKSLKLPLNDNNKTFFTKKKK
jgi:hypothetical protein